MWGKTQDMFSHMPWFDSLVSPGEAVILDELLCGYILELRSSWATGMQGCWNTQAPETSSFFWILVQTLYTGVDELLWQWDDKGIHTPVTFIVGLINYKFNLARFWTRKLIWARAFICKLLKNVTLHFTASISCDPPGNFAAMFWFFCILHILITFTP